MAKLANTFGAVRKFGSGLRNRLPVTRRAHHAATVDMQRKVERLSNALRRAGNEHDSLLGAHLSAIGQLKQAKAERNKALLKIAALETHGGDLQLMLERLRAIHAETAAAAHASTSAYKTLLKKLRVLQKEHAGIMQMEASSLKQEISRVPGVDISVWVKRANLLNPSLRGDLATVKQMGKHCLIGIGDVAGHGAVAGTVKNTFSDSPRVGLAEGAAASRMAGRLLASLERTNANKAVLESVRRYFDPVKKYFGPSRVLERTVGAINEHLYRLNDWEQSSVTTMVYGLYDQSGVFNFVNAGHPPLLVYRAATGAVEKIKGENLPAGVQFNSKFRHQTLNLNPGDVLVLYSDGVTEHAKRINGRRGEEFGTGRLAEALGKYGGTSASRISKNIKKLLIKHANKFPDDATLMVFKVKAE